MMRPLIALAACAMVTGACSDRSKELAPNASAAASLLEQTIAARIATCIAKGATQANCECHANTAARVLSQDDFIEQTLLLQSGNQAGLDQFQRRMFAEHRETMFSLGQALSACPTMRLKAE